MANIEKIRQLKALRERRDIIEDQRAECNKAISELETDIARDFASEGETTWKPDCEDIKVVKVETKQRYSLMGGEGKTTPQLQRLLQVIQAHLPDAEVREFRGMDKRAMDAAVDALPLDVRQGLVAEGVMRWYPQPVVTIDRRSK
jgi:hypothetical protein